MADYDAIVVGSGGGGMAAGLKLARSGHSVLLLEAAPQLGGCLSPIQKDGYSFDTGLHYVGELAKGDKLWKALDEIGLADRAEFIELNEDAIDRYVFPDFELRLCKGKERFKEQLIRLFPEEERGIHQYFEIYDKVVRAYDSVLDVPMRPLALLGWMFRNRGMLKYARVPYQALLESVTSDMRLQAALAAPWFDYMLPPETASVAYGIGTWAHYLSGGFYPRGGSGGFRDCFVEALREHGVEICSACRVTHVDRRGAELLVTAAGGTQWTSRAIVSDVDPVVMLGEIVNPGLIPSRVASKAKRLKPSASVFALYVGTDLDLPGLGMSTGNLAHYGRDDYDINQLFRDTTDSREPKLHSFMINSPTVRDPEAGLAPPGQHSLQILAGASYEAFERWAGLDPAERREDYWTFVRGLGDQLIAGVERYLPGLSEHLQLVEYFTPLDLQERIGLVRGGIYGPELTPEQLGPGRFSDGTCGVDGLFVAGAGAIGGSVIYSVLSGIQAGRKALAFLEA